MSKKQKSDRYILTSTLLIAMLSLFLWVNVCSAADVNDVPELENQIRQLEGKRSQLGKLTGNNAYSIQGEVVSDNGSSISVWGRSGDSGAMMDQTSNIQILNPNRALYQEMGGRPFLLTSDPLYRFVERTTTLSNSGFYVPLYVYKYDPYLMDIMMQILDVDNQISSLKKQIEDIYQKVKENERLAEIQAEKAKAQAEKDSAVNISVDDATITTYYNVPSDRPLYRGAVIIETKPYVTIEVLKNVLSNGCMNSFGKDDWVDFAPNPEPESNGPKLRFYNNGTIAIRVGRGGYDEEILRSVDQINRTLTKLQLKRYDNVALYPLEDILKILGWSGSWDEGTRTLTLKSPAKPDSNAWGTKWDKLMADSYKKLPANGIKDTPLGEVLMGKINEYTEIIQNKTTSGTNCDESYLERGKAYARLGMAKEANQDFKTVIDAHKEIGVTTYYLPLDRKAFNIIVDCWWNLGLGYEFLGMTREASQCYSNSSTMGKSTRELVKRGSSSSMFNKLKLNQYVALVE
jgi:hypothetical protein